VSDILSERLQKHAVKQLTLGFNADETYQRLTNDAERQQGRNTQHANRLHGFIKADTAAEVINTIQRTRKCTLYRCWHWKTVSCSSDYSDCIDNTTDRTQATHSWRRTNMAPREKCTRLPDAAFDSTIHLKTKPRNQCIG